MPYIHTVMESKEVNKEYVPDSPSVRCIMRTLIPPS